VCPLSLSLGAQYCNNNNNKPRHQHLEPTVHALLVLQYPHLLTLNLPDMSSSTLQKTLSTPTRGQQASPAQESPGNWRHPRLAEITRRQNATTFSEKNATKIAWNVASIVGIVAVAAVAHRYLPFS
jgi:hypothetical protein